VRRGGRLIYADNVRIDGGIAPLLDRAATFGGAQSFATLLSGRGRRMPIDELRAILPAATAWKPALRRCRTSRSCA
jgi:urease accessory protein